MSPKLPEKIIEHLKHPAVAAVFVTWAKKIGEEAHRYRKGEITPQELRKRARIHFAGILGTTVGATVGSVVGGRVPGVGAMVGAFGGSFVGNMVGEYFGHAEATKFEQTQTTAQKKEEPETEPEKSEGFQPQKRHL